MTKRVAGYGRVSTAIQALKGTSADVQKETITRECQAREYELFKFYSDEGFSGKSVSKRAGLQSLLKDAEQKKFDLVMFTKLDRLGRNLRDLLNVWNLLTEDYGLDLYCIEEPAVNTEGKMGKIMLAILGAFAEFERATIKERTSSGRIVRWKNGTAFIGQPPFGYRWNKEKKEIEIDETEKAIYERIVSMYLDQHLTLRDIAIVLTNEGIPSPSSKTKRKARAWNNMTVSKILKNRAYVGAVYHNKDVYESAVSKETGMEYAYAGKEQKDREQWIEIKFPALITEARYDQIQALTQAQKRKSKRVTKGYEDCFLLQNILYCGECKGKMRGTLKAGRDKLKRPYYVCHWKATTEKDLTIAGRERCIMPYTKANQIDERVFNDIASILSNPSKFAKDWLKDADIEELETRVNSLSEKERGLRVALEKGYDLITGQDDKDIKVMYLKKQKKDEEAYKTVKESLRQAEQELESSQDKVNRLAEYEKAMAGSKRDRMKTHFKTQTEFKSFLNSLPFSEKRRIVEAVISSENGGKVYLRRQRMTDIEDIEPERDFVIDGDPIIEMDFLLDIGKVAEILKGLNYSDFLSKLGTDTVSRQTENAHRRWWISSGDFQCGQDGGCSGPMAFKDTSH